MEDTSNQLPWSGAWKASSVEKINDYLFRMKDLSITNNDSDDWIKLGGKHILGFYNYFYWHMIHEDVAHYEGLKKDIPSLKLTLIDLFGATNEDGSISDDGKKRGPYLEYFLKKYPQTHRITSKDNIYIEEAYYIPTMGEVFPYYSGEPFRTHNVLPMSFPGPEYDLWCRKVWTERSQYGIDGLKILSRKMKRDSSSTSFSQKIFISRRDVNERLKEFIGRPEYDFIINERLYDDSFLEDYFSSKGYSVFALEELSYEDQISLFSNATHIAGTAGAGFANMHLCSPGTKLFELKVLPIYQFNYEYYRVFGDIDYHAIELRDGESDPPWPQEKILDSLDKIDFS